MILKFKLYGFVTLLAEKYWQYICFSLYRNDFHLMVRGGEMNRKSYSLSKAVKCHKGVAKQIVYLGV